jgi:hypothetical protein
MGLGVMGSMQQGQAQKTAYEAEAMAKRAQASQVDIAADREVALTRRRLDRTQNAQMVAFGKSGVLATTGSPLAMMEETAAQAFDEIQAIKGAARYRKSTLLTEADMSQYLGLQAEEASYYGAGGSILGGMKGNL